MVATVLEVQAKTTTAAKCVEKVYCCHPNLRLSPDYWMSMDPTLIHICSATLVKVQTKQLFLQKVHGQSIHICKWTILIWAKNIVTQSSEKGKLLLLVISVGVVYNQSIATTKMLSLSRQWKWTNTIFIGITNTAHVDQIILRKGAFIILDLIERLTNKSRVFL